MKKRIFVVAAVLFTGALHAQTVDSIANLEEVTVTATKFPKKISETGKVVNIITREELDRQGGKDLSQILDEQPGIIVSGSNSNLGKDKAVYMQGANYGYTLILLNGVPVVDPTGVGGAFDLRMIPVEQIERIEILKGAQSTLYGSDAVAGVINIITKKNGGKPATLFGGLSYGTNQTIRANAGLNGNFNGSSYNIGFVHRETKGISEAKDTLDKGIRNGLLNNAVSIDFNGKVAEQVYVQPFFRYSYYKGSIPNGAFVPAKNPYDAALINTGSQAVYHFNGGSVRGIFAYDEVKRNYEFSYGKFNYEGNKKTTEVFSDYNFGKYFQALAGFRYDQLLMKNPKPDVEDTLAKITSPYISLFLKDINGLNLELGGRYNNHSKYGDNFTYSINPSYLIGGKIKLFLNYGTAFRAPALTELYGQFGANPDLKPEKSNTFESGISIDVLDKKLSSRLVYFRRKINDVITYNSEYKYVNYNQQKDHGFDFEIRAKPTEPLDIRFFYSYVDGNVTTKAITGDTTYHNLFRRPKHSFGATLGYRISPQFFMSSDIHYFGERSDMFFDETTYQSLNEKLDSYTLWDLYAEYTMLKNRFKLFGQVTNILNADYYEVFGYSTLGREFTVGFRINL